MSSWQHFKTWFRKVFIAPTSRANAKSYMGNYSSFGPLLVHFYSQPSVIGENSDEQTIERYLNCFETDLPRKQLRELMLEDIEKITSSAMVPWQRINLAGNLNFKDELEARDWLAKLKAIVEQPDIEYDEDDE